MKRITGKVRNKFITRFHLTMLFLGIAYTMVPYLWKRTDINSLLTVGIGVLMIISTIFGLISGCRKGYSNSLLDTPVVCLLLLVSAGLYFGLVSVKLDANSLYPLYLYLVCILYTVVNKVFVKEGYLKGLEAGDVSSYLKWDFIVCAVIAGVYCIHFYITNPIYFELLTKNEKIVWIPTFIGLFCFGPCMLHVPIAMYYRKKYITK